MAITSALQADDVGSIPIGRLPRWGILTYELGFKPGFFYAPVL